MFIKRVMIEVHLYGKLRSLVSGSRANETFAQLVKRLGLEQNALGDCFIDGNLAKPGDKIEDGSRIGLFPFNMVLLCGGQHLKGHGYTKKNIDVDYY